MNFRSVVVVKTTQRCVCVSASVFFSPPLPLTYYIRRYTGQNPENTGHAAFCFSSKCELKRWNELARSPGGGGEKKRENR